MKKKFYLIILLIILLTGCSSQSHAKYYIKAIEFTSEESKILELSKMKAEKIFFEYNLPKKYKVIEFSYQTYQDGLLVNEESLQYGLDKDDYSGKLILEMSNDDKFSAQIKLKNSSGYSINSLSSDKIKVIENAKGYSSKFLTETLEIDNEQEIILAVYSYDTNGEFRTFSVNEYDHNPLYVLFKLKLLDDYKD